MKLERDDEEVEEEEEEERSRVRLDKEEMGKEEIIEEEEQKLVDYDSARRRFLSESASAAGEIVMVMKQVIFSMKILADTFLKKSPTGTFLNDSLLADSKSLFSSDSLLRIEVGLFCREHPCTWQIRKRTRRALW